MTWCVICIYPKRKQKFWVPGYNSGIYWNQEQPFRPFVAAMKTLLLIYASAENICYLQRYRWADDRTGVRTFHWRLFIGSSKTSLKAVLLYNGNVKPSIPVGYSILRKETYTMKILLDLLEYPKCNWKICSGLKVVSLLLGLQLGYTKHMCFLCLWNSQQDSSRSKSRPVGGEAPPI